MEEKDSFFEKLGRSLNLEDEQYEETSINNYSKQNTMEEQNEPTNLAVAQTAAAKTKKAKAKEEEVKVNSEEYEEEGRLTIDVYETDNEIVIKSTIAGVEPEDLDINITSDSVTIRGKRQKDEEISTENYFYQECYWGAFSRSVILPTEIDADKADATIKNGVLTIKLPKLSKTQQKKLKVKVE
ncbi:MAG: Hsp20/alpha crystallin family protein [Candidatus Spechtbacterales bacterium]|nr:Hsp20/alpha crystallin family protein [Candidatus Spechtbacterales bacterium]